MGIRLFSLCLLMVLAAGCSKKAPPMPDLHPVKGTLTMKGVNVSQGYVQFTPVEGSTDIAVNGEVNASGQFELQSQRGDQKEKAKGAPVGRYTVMYLPPVTSDQPQPLPIITTKIYQVEARSNEFTIELLDRK